MKSLHNDTLVASTTRGRNINVIDINTSFWSNYKTGFKKGTGEEDSKIRLSDGEYVVYWDKKVIQFNAKKKKRGQKKPLIAFLVEDIRAKDVVTKYIIVTESKDKANSFAVSYHNRRIKHHKGLARLALEMARARVLEQSYNRNGVSSESEDTAKNEVEVNKNVVGFNNGEVSIQVKDKIIYSALALKSGEQYVEQALQRAMNKMAGYLKSKIKDKSISDKIEIPFPELIRGTEA